MKGKSTFWDARFLSIISIVLLLFVIIGFLPKWLTTQSSLTNLDFTETGQIGDTINGIMGPFIAMIAAMLTFLAFWVQYKANEQLRRDIEVDRFENKFFELIRLHRENVEELSIKNNLKGREVFPEMFYELRYTFYTIKKIIEDTPTTTNNIDLGFEPDEDETILKITYVVFFLGINTNFKKSVIALIKDYCSDHFIRILIPNLETIKGSIPHQIKFKNGFELSYDPHNSVFEGFNSSLGHYYRHLFQAVKFVDQMDEKLLNNDKKYNYVKTLRAQLSNYEQLLIYYNAISRFGNDWIKEGYLINYKIIKNIPLPLADFGVIPEKKFEKEIEELRKNSEELFEWKEESKIK